MSRHPWWTSGQDALDCAPGEACLHVSPCMLLKRSRSDRDKTSGSKRLQKLWSDPIRDGRFRLAGTLVCLWGKSVSGPAATPSFYPLLRPELQVAISGAWSSPSLALTAIVSIASGADRHGPYKYSAPWPSHTYFRFFFQAATPPCSSGT